MNFYRLIILFIILLCSTSCQPKTVHKATVKHFYLMRHADRVEGQDSLSINGVKRSIQLSKTLSKVVIDVAYSSDYQRTKSTIEPLVKAMDLTIELYNPRELSNFMEALMSQNEYSNILIVGHSNTVPECLNILNVPDHQEQMGHDDYGDLYYVRYDGNAKIGDDKF